MPLYGMTGDQTGTAVVSVPVTLVFLQFALDLIMLLHIEDGSSEEEAAGGHTGAQALMAVPWPKPLLRFPPMVPCTLAGLSEQALTAASPRIQTTHFADAQGGHCL